MHTSIYSISESPKDHNTVWVGTDDGNLQITRDAGKNWTNVVGNVPGLPKFSWVSTVEASRYDPAAAYVTFDRHTFGDMKPYAFKTSDYGKTWTQLPLDASGVRGYAHAIKEDTQDPHLLFLGTELGLWISIDGGQRWAQYRGSNFPAVAVRDIAIQLRASDVVLATHGRGIWIIDDISPLRALTPDLMEKQAAFLPGRQAIQYFNVFGGWPEGDATYIGASRPTEAFISYYQRSRHIFGDLKIEIFDAQGKLVDTVPSSKHRGVNRATWSMRLKAPRVPPAASALFGAAFGPRVLPGEYTVKLTKGDQVYTTKLNVVLDPRAKYTVGDRKAQYDLAVRLSNMLNHMSWAVDSIIGVRDAAQQRAAKLRENDPLRRQLLALSDSADKIRTRIVATKEGGMITGEERLREWLGALYGDVNQYEGRPTDSQVHRADVLHRQLDDVVGEFTTIADKQVPVINRALGAKKLEAIRVMSEADWQKANASEESNNSASTGAFGATHRLPGESD
jgi:hypothetical protein